MERAAVVGASVKGVFVNSTDRLTDVSKPTTIKLLDDLGTVRAEYHDQHVRGLKPARIQTVEVRSSNYCKAENVATAISTPAAAGAVWNWTAIDGDSRIIIAFRVGL